MTDFDLGARLRDIRESRGLSQRELAEAAGVTNGAISLIERNLSSPSVSSLVRILAVHGIPLSDFFASEPDSPDDFVFRGAGMQEINPARVHGGTPDGLSLKRVGSTRRGSTLLMLYECYEPGADTGAEGYSHEGEEVGYVISGEIVLTVAGRSEVLRAGDGYQFASNKPHRFRNLAAEPCLLVSACTPATF